MKKLSKKIRIITHSGTFHADELLAIAALQIYLKDTPSEIIRTRDSAIIATGDFVVDVGAVYDPSRNRFDHHQHGGAGERANGIPYSAFGLVWKHYGKEICESEKIAKMIDEQIGYPVDMGDNGIDYYGLVQIDVEPLILQFIVAMFRPTWKQEANADDRFAELVVFLRRMLELTITVERNKMEGAKIVEQAYQDAKDKRVIVLDGPYPWQEALSVHPEPMYIVKPKSLNNFWEVECVRDNPHGFANRKDLPEEWAGKFDGELALITGVPDSIFCHNRRYIAVTKTKESAMRLALMARDA